MKTDSMEIFVCLNSLFCIFFIFIKLINNIGYKSFFRHEKKMFEKYQKAARDIPNKKEREEIETMKSQVCFQLCWKFFYQFTEKKPKKTVAVKIFL